MLPVERKAKRLKHQHWLPHRKHLRTAGFWQRISSHRLETLRCSGQLGWGTCNWNATTRATEVQCYFTTVNSFSSPFTQQYPSNVIGQDFCFNTERDKMMKAKIKVSEGLGTSKHLALLHTHGLSTDSCPLVWKSEQFCLIWSRQWCGYCFCALIVWFRALVNFRNLQDFRSYKEISIKTSLWSLCVMLIINYVGRLILLYGGAW